MITTESFADAATRCEAKLYKHARTTRNLTATPDMQRQAVEASSFFFWTCFCNPQGKRVYEELSRATH